MKTEKEEKLGWGETNEKGEKQFSLHKGQSKALKANTRFVAAVAGTGGGKTVIGPLWLMNRIKELQSKGKKEGMVGMVIAPTYKILSRATAPALVETFRGTDLEGRFLDTKGVYILPGKLGTIYLLSADNPNGLEGGQLDIGAWLDEAGQMTYSAWLAIGRRTGVNRAPIFITTTPYLSNWLKTEFIDAAISGDPDYTVVNWSSVDNPVYSLEEFERAKRTLPRHTFEMMYKGLFSTAEGLVYPDLENCIVDDDEIEVQGRLVGGMDFGWRAPFCAISGILSIENGIDTLYINNEIYRTKTLLRDWEKTLPKKVKWYADPSEPDQIRELLKRRHYVVPANNAIKVGIEAVYERIITGRLKISRTCVNLIAEGRLYQYTDSEEEEEKPVDGLDHAMDALRYLCMGISVSPNLKVVERAVVARRAS